MRLCWCLSSPSGLVRCNYFFSCLSRVPVACKISNCIRNKWMWGLHCSGCSWEHSIMPGKAEPSGLVWGILKVSWKWESQQQCWSLIHVFHPELKNSKLQVFYCSYEVRKVQIHPLLSANAPRVEHYLGSFQRFLLMCSVLRSKGLIHVLAKSLLQSTLAENQVQFWKRKAA